jgi:hypothetical protein
MRWLNLLFVLLVNAVPLYGVKELGWSASTVVVLYWFENLLIAFFTCARIALHRKLTRKRGHWRQGQLGTKVNNQPSTAGLLGEYATMAFVFTFAHGIFVGAFVLIGAENHGDDPHWAFSRVQFWQGAELMALALIADFIVDALAMRGRSFAWIRTYVDQRMGRVIIMHLAIIFGMWGMMATESPFAVLYVLIGLKTLWDLASTNASAKAAAALPDQPPAWALKLADSVAKKDGGAKKMARDWEQQRENMIRAAREDEEVMPA